MMDVSNRSALPDLATWPVFGVIIALLLGALVLDAVLSPHWTDPFREAGTWVLVGVALGFALRGVGHWRARRERGGETTLRRLSLAVWAAAALGGFLSFLL